MEKRYSPDLQDFASGLQPGNSILQCESHKGRTKREREKQNRRANRVRARGLATGDGKGIYKE
jgi:hypothetical protein